MPSLATVVTRRRIRKKTEPPQILSGWKEIANCLGKGVRTVQRYERYMGLPVRRPAGKSSGSVVATKAELDAWVSASPIREAFQLTRPGFDIPAATAAAIAKGIAEMGRLRDQMKALRGEVSSSIHSLREGVLGLQGQLRQDEWRAPASPPTILERSDRKRSTVDLLATYTRHRKVN